MTKGQWMIIGFWLLKIVSSFLLAINLSQADSLSGEPFTFLTLVYFCVLYLAFSIGGYFFEKLWRGRLESLYDVQMMFIVPILFGMTVIIPLGKLTDNLKSFESIYFKLMFSVMVLLVVMNFYFTFKKIIPTNESINNKRSK